MASTITEVRRLTRGWRAAPAVHVVESHRELPVPADEACEAMYHRGEVFVTDGHDPARVAQLVGHEVVAHHGLRALLGREGWGEFMRSVDGGTRGDQLLADLKREVYAAYGDLPAALAADEAAALLVERRIDPASGRLDVERPLQKRVQAAAAQAARELLYLEVAANADELEGSLLEAEALLREGPSGLLPGSAWWYRPAMSTSKPMGANPPPRNLSESESMLAAEAYRLNSPGEWKMVGTFASAVGGVFMAVAGIGYLLLLVLGVVHI